MANLPKFTGADFRNEYASSPPPIHIFFFSAHPVDFSLKRVFDMPAYEQMIFMYVNFDKCRKQIMRYEDKRSTPSATNRHPKESKKEALDLLRCHSKK